MEEVLRTSDGIALSTYRAALKAAGIESYVFDLQVPIIEGALGAQPCRLMVSAANAERARALIAEYHQALAGAFPDVDLSTDGPPVEDPLVSTSPLLHNQPETFWWQEEDDPEPEPEPEPELGPRYDEVPPEEDDFADDSYAEDGPEDSEDQDEAYQEDFSEDEGEYGAEYDGEEGEQQLDLPPDELPPPPPAPDPVTITTLLGGKVQLVQPKDGYRAAIDPVLLAAAVPSAGWRIGLDVGAGTGAAMLCLLARCQDRHIIGLEVQEDHARLARQSIALNQWQAQAHIVMGDIRLRPSLTSNAFDQVLSNPPFHGPGTRPPHGGRAVAHMEEIPLEHWIGFCLRMLKPRGGLTVIHRADRLDELLSVLQGKAGAIEVIPLWPKRATPARRVIVRARKGMRTPMVLHPGLILHNSDGSFTDATEAILREGISLDEALARQ